MTNVLDKVSKAMNEVISESDQTIAGYAAQHLNELDGPFAVTNTMKAFGSLWFGSAKPTLILSSMAVKKEMVKRIIQIVPVNVSGHFGFKWNGADWIDDDRITDGRIFMLNENYPMSPRYNGWFMVTI